MVVRVNITNQGSGFTSRPIVMASDSICPECPSVPMPTCPSGLDCLQINYGPSGICPISYTCIVCATTTTTTTTTTISPRSPTIPSGPLNNSFCEVPASSFTVSHNSYNTETDFNSDGFIGLGNFTLAFKRDENDTETLWPGYDCVSKKVYSYGKSLYIKTDNPQFIVTRNGNPSLEVKGDFNFGSGESTVLLQGLTINWIGTDPSIFAGNKEIELTLTFEVEVVTWTNSLDYIANPATNSSLLKLTTVF